MEGASAHDSQVAPFRAALARIGEPGVLFHAVLLTSAVHDSLLEGEWWRPAHRELDRFAAEAGALGIGRGQSTPQTVAELRRFALYFCETLRFGGEREDYHAAENSMLTQVVARRQGLPISLAVVMIELGRRLGIELHGVATPGHFLVGATADTGACFVDPFSGPEILDTRKAVARVHDISHAEPAQIADCMAPADHLEIVKRVLNNFKVTYANRGDFGRLLTTLDWLLALDPADAGELRNRGLILLRTGEGPRGARDLLRYLELVPEPDDLEIIRREARRALSFQGGEEGGKIE